MSATRDEVTAGNAFAMHIQTCHQCLELEPCMKRDEMHAAAVTPAINRNAWRRERDAGQSYAMHLDGCTECRELQFCPAGTDLLAAFQNAMDAAPLRTIRA